jgi:hypothetical protein
MKTLFSIYIALNPYLKSLPSNEVVHHIEDVIEWTQWDISEKRINKVVGNMALRKLGKLLKSQPIDNKANLQMATISH